jgi:hypothetical protein
MICVVGVFGPPPLREKFYGDRGCRVEMDVFGPPPRGATERHVGRTSNSTTGVALRQATAADDGEAPYREPGP